MLMAMGAVMGERWVASLSKTAAAGGGGGLLRGTGGVRVLYGCGRSSVASGGRLMEFALKNNGDLREEIGWDDLVKTVAGIRDSLPPEQRENVGMAVGNYGEQGAIEILGPGISLAAADQRDELGMVARISCAAADDADCAGLVARGGGATVHCVPSGRA